MKGRGQRRLGVTTAPWHMVVETAFFRETCSAAFNLQTKKIPGSQDLV